LGMGCCGSSEDKELKRWEADQASRKAANASDIVDQWHGDSDSAIDTVGVEAPLLNREESLTEKALRDELSLVYKKTEHPDRDLDAAAGGNGDVGEYQGPRPGSELSEDDEEDLRREAARNQPTLVIDRTDFNSKSKKKGKGKKAKAKAAKVGKGSEEASAQQAASSALAKARAMAKKASS
jgi:hypothetical protein